MYNFLTLSYLLLSTSKVLFYWQRFPFIMTTQKVTFISVCLHSKLQYQMLCMIYLALFGLYLHLTLNVCIKCSSSSFFCKHITYVNRMIKNYCNCIQIVIDLMRLMISKHSNMLIYLHLKFEFFNSRNNSFVCVVWLS